MLKIDLHIHTIASGHAFQTFYEVLEQAARKKMKMIAIADHGPSFENGANHTYFRVGWRCPKEYKGVKVLFGCEANIVDKKGTLDVHGKTRERLDIVLVGLHRDDSMKDYGKKGNTEVLLSCFEKEKPHIFSHPDAMKKDYDFEKVCNAALDNDILLEVNISSLLRSKKYPHLLDNLKKMINIVKKRKKKVIVNSDAHFLNEIGDDTLLKKYKKKIGLTDDLIINNYPKELMKILKRK